MPRRPSPAPSRRKAPAAGARPDGPARADTRHTGTPAARPARASRPAAAAPPSRGGGKKAALERAERRTQARGDTLPIIDVGAPGSSDAARSTAPARTRRPAAATAAPAPRKASASRPSPDKPAPRKATPGKATARKAASKKTSRSR